MSRPRREPGSLGKISCSENSSGTWTASAWLTDERHRRVRLRATAASEEGAVDALQEKAAAALRTRRPLQLRADHTVAEAVAIWCRITEARQPTISAHTVENYARWGGVLIEFAGDMPLLELATVPAIDALILDIREQRSNASATGVRAALAGLSKLAARHGIISGNPVRDTEAPPAAAKIESALTGEQFQLLLGWVRAWRLDQRGGRQPDRALLEDLILLSAATSARVSEPLALRRQDVVQHDVGDGITVAIRGKVVEVKGGGAVREAWPKHSRQARTITVPAFAHPAIHRRLAHSDPDLSDLLIHTSTGRPMSKSNASRLLRSFRDDHREKIEHELGVPLSEFTFKLFRRTAATIVDGSGSTELAARLLGHADPRTTRRHYATHLPAVAPETAAILDAQLGAGTGENPARLRRLA